MKPVSGYGLYLAFLSRLMPSVKHCSTRPLKKIFHRCSAGLRSGGSNGRGIDDFHHLSTQNHSVSPCALLMGSGHPGSAHAHQDDLL